MVETLTIWNDGVSSMDAGKFEEALTKFSALEGRTDSSQQLITSGRNLFNIGQTYLALGELENAAQVINKTSNLTPFTELLKDKLKELCFLLFVLEFLTKVSSNI